MNEPIYSNLVHSGALDYQLFAEAAVILVYKNDAEDEDDNRYSVVLETDGIREGLDDFVFPKDAIAAAEAESNRWQKLLSQRYQNRLTF